MSWRRKRLGRQQPCLQLFSITAPTAAGQLLSVSLADPAPLFVRSPSGDRPRPQGTTAPATGSTCLENGTGHWLYLLGERHRPPALPARGTAPATGSRQSSWRSHSAVYSEPEGNRSREGQRVKAAIRVGRRVYEGHGFMFMKPAHRNTGDMRT
ncbi:hypothetical protein EYF80_042227 [Liparis tanakae]|uniref:Uncharacterized protein n=1 Tax=Liparis tanakae TaxID=230148 RepID=A0A4Z2G3G6_9TELE|nr:hypothetical protein EYF80_042227 [Liparis tanakae]